MMRRTGSRLIMMGSAAGRGRVDEEIVRFYLGQGYFAEPPPKSLDRNVFTTDCIERLSTDDGAATLAAFTAQAIARSREHMPERARAMDRLQAGASQPHDHADAGRNVFIVPSSRPRQ